MAVHARQTKLGINVATSGSWSTGAAVATAVGTGDGHYVRDDIRVQLQMMQSPDDSAGQNFIGSVQSGNTEALAITVPMYLHYNDAFQNVLWALTLGTGGTSPTQVGTTTAYTNTFEPATNKTGRYASIVRDKVQYVSEVPGVKFSGFELSFGDSGRAEINWLAMGDVEKSDSTVNTSTQISALTFPTLGRRAFFDDATLRVNSQSGGSLGAGDKLYISSLRVRFSQPMDQRFVSGATTIIEPEENGFPEISLEIEFGRYDSASHAFFAAHRDTTAYKADLTFVGPTLATTTYGLVMQFPNLIVSSYQAPVDGGAGQVIPSMSLRALSTTAAPTGMTGVTAPMRVVTTGVSTTNPFA